MSCRRCRLVFSCLLTQQASCWKHDSTLSHADCKTWVRELVARRSGNIPRLKAGKGKAGNPNCHPGEQKTVK